MSQLNKYNRVGRCINCEVEIYEIKTQWPVGHMLAGEARSVGKPLDNARIVTLLQANGHQCNVTMCESCAAEPKALSMSDIWKRVLLTWSREIDDEYRQVIGSLPLKPEQYKKAEMDIVRQIENIPIGVLTVRKAGEQNG